ncbi:hypothetical protein B8W95_13075, partial [Staphylococcus pasteuri]
MTTTLACSRSRLSPPRTTSTEPASASRRLSIYLSAENESGKHIQRLRSDSGGEYTSHEFRDFLAEYGIHHEMPPLYSPQANGVAER